MSSFYGWAIRLLSYGTASGAGLLGLMLIAASRGRSAFIIAGLGFLATAVFFAFVPTLLPALRKLASTRIRREAEHSAHLRSLTFAGQVIGILSLAQPTQLWPVAVIAVLILAFGHRYAYLHRAKP